MNNIRALKGAHDDKRQKSLELGESRTSPWKEFMSLIKIGIVNSNMITTFAGLWLALHFLEKSFLDHLGIIFLTLAGSSLIIAGSCIMNNLYDRDIDFYMERTKQRPTVTGSLNLQFAFVLGLAFIILGLAALFLTTVTAGIIGIIGVFSYVILYTVWTKRRFVSNTIVGSISGAVPPLIGWAAVDPGLHIIAWSLFLLMFIWQPPHFYALAMRRVEEYRAAGVPMLPVVKGATTTKKHIIAWVALLLPIPFLLHELGIVFMVIATLLNLGWLYIGISKYNKIDDIAWAKSMFVYSLQYMTIIFTAMVIVTLI